jgi:hypothetical protein
MIVRCKICGTYFAGVLSNGINSHVMNRHNKRHDEIGEFVETLCE